MSPYTSFLVQEDEPMAAVLPDRGRRDTAPLSGDKKGAAFSAGGVRTESVSRHQAADLFAAPSAVGKAAVDASLQMKELRESDRFKEQPAAGVRRLENRTFHLRDSFWIESGYDGIKTVDVVHGSEAYVNLLLCYPELGRFMTLGERIVLRFKGVYLRIGDEGVENRSRQQWRRVLG